MRHPADLRARICFDPMTAIMIGLSVASASSQMSQANKQAKATIAEGNIVAANKAKDVQRLAATQRVSFLNSGLTLEGTPMNVIDSTFNTGIADINQISSNYNTKAKGQISAGRSAALSSLASGFTGMAMPDLGIGDSLSFGTNSFNGVGQAVSSGFSSSSVGPFQSPMRIIG